MDGASVVEPSDPPGICALCHRVLSSENDAIDVEAMSICGDCKFLFLEDSDVQRRTPRTRTRRTRYTNTNSSSESIENIFSSMINLTTRDYNNNHHQSIDNVPRTRTHSRRWRRIVSDTESEGFDSVYGESDTISFVAYGGSESDSDVSVNVHGFNGDSDDDDDTDIDPMHARLNNWNSDEEDDEEEEEDYDEEDDDENTLGSLIARVHLRRTMESESEGGGGVRIRINETVGPASDYLDARSFEELLERLADADNSRRGAPPASVSYVDSLERVVVKEEEFNNGAVCAICKECVCVGSVVNQLPCLHVYHPWCIKPWLSARNSCPLCRYELPTDDVDYENRKQQEVQQQQQQQQRRQEEEVVIEENEDSVEMRINESRNGRWLFVAAPVVSLVGVAIALWFGNRGGIGGFGLSARGQSGGQRGGGNRSRRWWSLF